MGEYIYEHSRCHDQFGKPLDAPMLTQREEIVRCRDCRHYDDYLGACLRPSHNFAVEPDGFCKWVEKKTEQDKQSELKPCPFCGCKAIYETFTHYYDDEDTVTVFCNGCKSVVILEQNEAEGVNDETRERARMAWNTRAERTCHVVPHGYCIANGDESCCRCWSCSECSYGWHVSDYDRQYRYCPNCGAKVTE